MDWMKLEVLIAVRNNIADEINTDFICNQLKKEMQKRYDYTSKEELLEFFPEFFSLYDGKYWAENEDYEPLYAIYPCQEGAWWHSSDIQSRLDILDFIIANRSM